MFSPMGLKGFVPGERALGMEMSNDTPSDNEAFCPPAALIPLHREPQPAAALPALCASALRRRVALPLSRPPAPAVAMHTQSPQALGHCRACTYPSSARPCSSEAQSGRPLRWEVTSLPAWP